MSRAKRRPKTSGKPGARCNRVLRMTAAARSAYERKLERDRERLRKVYHERRESVFARHDHRCAACGCELDKINREIDHEDTFLRTCKSYQPHRSGWLAEAAENYQPLCIPCHDRKTVEDRRKRWARSIESANSEEAPF